ncbi:hypothetical protein J6590_012423 [Homalodisca vitripennis]|nr:hypothetical protein J6590_012423 [Homalodisca vitripennis]
MPIVRIWALIHFLLISIYHVEIDADRNGGAVHPAANLSMNDEEVGFTQSITRDADICLLLQVSGDEKRVAATWCLRVGTKVYPTEPVHSQSGFRGRPTAIYRVKQGTGTTSTTTVPHRNVSPSFRILSAVSEYSAADKSGAIINGLQTARFTDTSSVQCALYVTQAVSPSQAKESADELAVHGIARHHVPNGADRRAPVAASRLAALAVALPAAQDVYGFYLIRQGHTSISNLWNQESYFVHNT